MWWPAIDDATLLLTLAIVVVLAIGAAQRRVLQPALHPLVLARQGVPARVRSFQHSPVFRNANSPLGSPLAARPRAAAQNVASLVRLGARTSAVTGTIGAGSVPTSAGGSPAKGNARPSTISQVLAPTVAKPCGALELLSLAAQLVAGVRVLAQSDGNVTVALSAGHFTDLAAATLLLPAVDTSEPDRIRLLVLPSGAVPHCGPFGPRPIPVLSTTAEDLSTGLLDTPLFTQTRIVVVPDADLEVARTAPAVGSKRLLSVSEVVQAVQNTTQLTTAIESVSSLTIAPAPGTDTALLTKPQSIYAHFYTPNVQSWAGITEVNLTAGVTAHLGAFAPYAIPTQRDRIGVVSRIQEDGDEVASALSPTSSPSGLALLLLAIYTGAGIQFDLDAFATTAAWADGPTMLYSNPSAAKTVATACVKHSHSSFFGAWATRAALYRLRHGVVPTRTTGMRTGSGAAGRFWDWIYFRSARWGVIPHLRSLRHVTIVSSSGREVGQNTLDVLRAFLGVSTVHAYLPSEGKLVGYEKLGQADKPLSAMEMASAASSLGVPPGTAAIFTAPVSVSHASDLQAFDAGPYGAAHTGPPTVSAEVQLVETSQLKQQGFTIEAVDAKGLEAMKSRTRWPDDPAGTILVRGPITALAFRKPLPKLPDPVELWISTRDVGSFRPNGTLGLVATLDSKGSAIQSEVEDVPALGDAYYGATSVSEKKEQ